MQKKQKKDLVCSLVLYELYIFVIYQYTPGKIPLRNLVYRVQELPPSMRSLVYDFGQLKEEQEERYISHIVNNNVSLHLTLSAKQTLYKTFFAGLIGDRVNVIPSLLYSYNMCFINLIEYCLKAFILCTFIVM